MPEKATIRRAQQDKREGKAASTQAGEFVREEMEHIREGKHGAKSAKQAVAIGLSKARRSGVALPARGKSAARPKRKAGTRKATTRKSPARKATTRKAPARKATTRKASPRRSASRIAMPKTSAKRSRAGTRALQGKPRRAASRVALSRQAHAAARKRTKADRSAAARKAARTRARSSR